MIMGSLCCIHAKVTHTYVQWQFREIGMSFISHVLFRVIPYSPLLLYRLIGRVLCYYES